MSDWYKTAAQVQVEAEAAEKRKSLQELKDKLSATDHKTFSDYEPLDGEDVQAIMDERKEWRREARDLIAWLDNKAPE